MDALDAQINALDASFATLTTESAKAQNMQQRAGLLAQRATKFETLRAMQAIVKNRTDSLVSDAAAINYHITPQDVYEINEKQINSVYFNTIARGVTQFTEAEKQIINTMAPLCPKIAGKGVYRARFLQSVYDNVVYTDEENCIINTPGGGASSRMSKDIDISINAEDVKIYPNPTRDILNIEMPNSLNYNLIIRDVTGRIVHQETINGSSQISVINFENGLYLSEFWHKGKRIAHKKIIVIH
jgi:hypothetical protein